MSTIGIKNRVFAVVNINHPNIAQNTHAHADSKIKITVCRDNRFYSEEAFNKSSDIIEYTKSITQEYRKANPDMRFGATITMEIYP